MGLACGFGLWVVLTGLLFYWLTGLLVDRFTGFAVLLIGGGGVVLFKIWVVRRGGFVPCSLPFGVVEGGCWAFPLVEVIGSLGGDWCRGDFVSVDRGRLERALAYFNDIACDDEFYEIRGEVRGDD